MGQILGMSVSQFPLLRMKPADMTNILKGLMRTGWRDQPGYKDPSNWPPLMRKDWGDDDGLATVARAQAHQIEQFRTLRAALEAFAPDCIVMLYRDMGEPWSSGTGEPGSFRPQYWMHGQEAVTIRPYQSFAGGSNYWDADPDIEVSVPLHQGVTAHLISATALMYSSPVRSSCRVRVTRWQQIPVCLRRTWAARRRPLRQFDQTLFDSKSATGHWPNALCSP